MTQELKEKAIKLADQITDWEGDAGESFTDYFMHDNVADNSWAFWLLGKGYTERANEIILELLAGNKCLDQDLLYELHEVYTYDDTTSHINMENYEKNVLLWAEFLVSTPFYFYKVIKFLTDKDED